MSNDDTGVLERPRDIAVSTSHQQLQPPQTRSLRGGGTSEAGTRSLHGASEAGTSSSLRRTSPDHIPRLHECWSLEPVRRATTAHHQDHRSTGLPSSELSSLDSIPTKPPPPAPTDDHLTAS